MKVCAHDPINCIRRVNFLLTSMPQRQTVISQFYQLDRLVVEGGASVGSLPQILHHRNSPSLRVRRADDEAISFDKKILCKTAHSNL